MQPTVSPRSRADGLDTEQSILAAAGEIIATEDFDALSMRRVATKAGVSLSTVVRHFGTKDALLAALVAQGDDDQERLDLRSRMEPGDVAAAVGVVAGDYEEAGQQLMHMLGQEHRFPALSELLDIGRRGHRRWVRWAFSPQLAGRTDAARTQLEDLLVVATDVYTWKLLRIDRRLSAGNSGGHDRVVRGGGGAMSRFLLATWDGGGTIPPELGVVAALVARGHEVVVLSDDTVEQEATEAGARFAPWQRAPQARARDFDRALIRDWEVKNPLAQVRQVGDLLFFGPASDHAADLADVIARTSPDVLIVDALLTGASAGAEASGLPTAAIAPNVNMLRAPGVPPMGSGLRPLDGRIGRARDAILYRLNDVLMGTGTLNDTRRDLGLEPVGSLEESVRRADRVIFLTSEAFDFTPTRRDPRVVYGGIPIPANERGDVEWSPPWVNDGRPAVLLSLSTTYMAQEGLLQRLVDALGMVDCHALVTTGRGLRSHSLARVPNNVYAVESVPHGAVLPHVQLVISHGGHGTVVRSLAAGVPVMVVPISRDQPDNAVRVVHHGAGLKMSKRSSPNKFADAIRRALADGEMRARAAELAARMSPDVGAPKAIDALEALVPVHR